MEEYMVLEDPTEDIKQKGGGPSSKGPGSGHYVRRNKKTKEEETTEPKKTTGTVVKPTTKPASGTSAFHTGKIAVSMKLGDDTLNETLKVKIEGDGTGLWKPEEINTKDQKKYVKDAKDFVDYKACSMSKREVMACQLDRTLKMGLIPDTVMKEHEGKQGSCQAWVDNFQTAMTKTIGTKSGLTHFAESENIPTKTKREMAMKAAAFDDLLANTDRHAANVGFNGERIVFIDNGASFAHSPEKAWNGQFASEGGKGFLRKVFGTKSARETRMHRIYIAQGKKIGESCFKNKASINEMFETNKLPKTEQEAFWNRAHALMTGTMEEHIWRRETA